MILDTFNDTRRDYPRDATIHQLFQEQVAARPDAIAVVCADSRVSYGELNAWAGDLADAFCTAGVRPGDRVALLMDKTPAMVAATLAVLRLGAAYVPVDPSLPIARRDFLLADSRARLVVTDTDVLLDAVRVHRLGQSRATGTVTTPAGSPVWSGGPEDTAYVMYTSGTTGHPKGVLINQRSVVRLVKGSDVVRLTPRTCVLQTGATGFDATTFEVWGALLNGGTLVLVPQETILRADLMARAIADHGVTTMWLTSPLFNQLVEQDAALFDGCELLVGGEALSSRHVGMALDAPGEVRIVNGYGPTENTTFSTYHPVTRDDLDRIPIGRPIPNSTAYVLDVDGRLLPPGVTGELHVGGDGLSIGYLNRPDLEELAFVTAGFGTEERLYRTGDLARWTPAGNLEFLGRTDTQVKVRGFRVEPAEAEEVLRRVAGVREAVVLASEGASGTALRAYATVDAGLTPDTVLAALTDQLPHYLVPSSLHIVKAMPLNQNGKSDRAALAALPVENRGGLPHTSAPRTPDEELLARLFARILGRDTVGVEDNFFALGGHSLLATRLWVQIRSETGAEIELKEVLETPTVAELAVCLGRLPAASAASARPRLERRS
ncbi:amino acid adenylation domain-containing protein [Streptomyces sp. NPDC059076]|uniref:amino acid adenylation domain-containing protein n=1 Tax=unclassified Streptomyces TaxID=2593676 RepID=UPI0036B0D1AA